LTQTSTNERDDPGEIIRTLALSASTSVLFAFACHCCRRIDSLIPTEAGRDALKTAEQNCSKPVDSPTRLTSMVKLAKADEEEMRAKMNRVAEVDQMSLEHTAACATYYAALAARMTAEYCSNPALEAADEISDMVALARAFFTNAQSEANDALNLKDMQNRFDQFYNAERLAHCELLRTCWLRGQVDAKAAADGETAESES
jgi:hypothetical protein